MHQRVGVFLTAIGVLHALVGMIGYGAAFAAIGQERFFNTVDGRPQREAALWFVASGLLLIMLGGLCRWTQRRLDGALPAPLGWGLLGFSSAGIVIMPLSGFWLVLPQALLVLRASRTTTTATPRDGGLPDDSFLNQVMPAYDVNDAHTRRIAAPPPDVYAALKQVTLRDIPIAASLMGVRDLPTRLIGRPVHHLPDDRPLLDSFFDAGFTLLGEQPDREIVAGTIDQFWKLRGGAPFHTDNAAEFAAFAVPGYAKAAVTFHLRPVPGGTLLTTETRVLATDPAARRAFRRYWRVIYPGSALIRWALLRAIGRKARDQHRVGLAVPDAHYRLALREPETGRLGRGR
ncbi:MAG: DUF6463 family protein [Dehalococcoidia bacterium]